MTPPDSDAPKKHTPEEWRKLAEEEWRGAEQGLAFLDAVERDGCMARVKPDSDAREVTTTQEPRGARFTILPDSVEANRDFIILDVPPAQARALHEKVAQVLTVSTDSAVTPDTLIGVYLEVEPHPCMNIGRHGEEVFPRPPSLLCGEGAHLDLDLAQRILAALEEASRMPYAAMLHTSAERLRALAAELRAHLPKEPK